MAREIVEVRVEDIVVKDTAIRKVDTKNEKFINLMNDIKINGQEIPIIVNKELDEETQTEILVLSDGRHRLTALQELGEIFALAEIREMDEVEGMGLQMRLNMLRVDQTRSQESNQLVRMLAMEDMTIEKLAKTTGMSVATLRDKLKLNEDHLSDKAVTLMDNKAITANNAKTLASLPKESQTEEVIQAAQTMDTKMFADHIHTVKVALNKGQDPKPKKGPAEFEARPKFRDKEVLLGEIKSRSLAKAKFSNPAEQEAFIEGVSYALSLDDETVSSAKEAFELQQQEQARIKQQKEIARLEAKKAEHEARIEAAKKLKEEIES